MRSQHPTNHRSSTGLLLVCYGILKREQIQFGFNTMSYWHSLECFSRLAATVHPCEKARASIFKTNLGKHCVLFSIISFPLG